MEPVPNRISLPSAGSSSPSSISGDRRRSEETGNRGKGRLVMKAGKTLSKEMNSGLDRSGVVHVRMYSRSASSKVVFGCGVPSSSSSSPKGPKMGLGGSSLVSAATRLEPGVWLIRRDDGAGLGLSVNGSLGARGRLA
jgi:hypothetical protein